MHAQVQCHWWRLLKKIFLGLTWMRHCITLCLSPLQWWRQIQNSSNPVNPPITAVLSLAYLNTPHNQCQQSYFSLVLFVARWMIPRLPCNFQCFRQKRSIFSKIFTILKYETIRKLQPDKAGGISHRRQYKSTQDGTESYSGRDVTFVKLKI